VALLWAEVLNLLISTFTYPTASTMSTGIGSLDRGSKDNSAPNDISLLEYLDLSQLNCLNEAESHSFKSIVASKSRNATGSYLLSDADEQLLLNIPFNQAVRIRSIILKSNDIKRAPKTVKLLINRPSLGFEDVEDVVEPEAAQILELTSEQAEGKPIQLRFVRFQSVNSLHLFVESTHGGEDESRIDVLDIFGVPVEATKDLGGLKSKEE